MKFFALFICIFSFISCNDDAFEVKPLSTNPPLTANERTGQPSPLRQILTSKGFNTNYSGGGTYAESGCNCEIKVNSITGSVSEWSVVQQLDCCAGIGCPPIFAIANEVCCSPCNTDAIGVWKPFYCNHPSLTNNTVFFASAYYGSDNCTTIHSNIIFEPPCSFDYFTFPATASVSIRCKNSQGQYGTYNTVTFSLSSNQGVNPCATLGTLGSRVINMNNDCQFRE